VRKAGTAGQHRRIRPPAWRREAAAAPIAEEVIVKISVKAGSVVRAGFLVLAAGLFLHVPDAAALDILAAQTLARQSGCLQCHSVYQKKSGPAWKDVAAKYHGAPDAAPRLYKHVTTGRKAKFDDGHEEAHPIVKTTDPKRIGNLVEWILVLPVAAPVDVKAAQSLATQSGCLKCHAVDTPKAGPAWKVVAAKYLGSPGAEDKLYRHVTTGRMAKFEDGHEENHPIVKTHDPDRINNLVNWILSLR
jgi:cytochrome c